MYPMKTISAMIITNAKNTTNTIPAISPLDKPSDPSPAASNGVKAYSHELCECLPGVGVVVGDTAVNVFECVAVYVIDSVIVDTLEGVAVDVDTLVGDTVSDVSGTSTQCKNRYVQMYQYI